MGNIFHPIRELRSGDIICLKTSHDTYIKVSNSTNIVQTLDQTIQNRFKVHCDDVDKIFFESIIYPNHFITIESNGNVSLKQEKGNEQTFIVLLGENGKIIIISKDRKFLFAGKDLNLKGIDETNDWTRFKPEFIDFL